MNFLPKASADIESCSELTYPNDRDKACAALIRLQKGFCAYSERYLKPLDSVEVEHFDPRKKNTSADGFHNWHAVIRWMNAHKYRRIDRFEPLPDLSTWTADRVSYERGLFVCDVNDVETRNLIEFLGINKQEVFEERSNQVARLRRAQQKYGDSLLRETLVESPEELSFPTAIQSELGIPAFELIDQALAADQ